MSNTTPGYLTNSDLDFQSLKQNLKLFMSQQALFKDWNWEGSNISVMLDLLTYNTTLKAFYLNFAGSEMFFDSSQLRESIVSHAKELNYSPRSRTSAFVNLQVQLGGNDIPGVVVLPTGFAISATGSNGSSLTFITDTPTVLTSENNWTANVNFYEGRLITETFVSNTSAGNSSLFALESANVDTTSIYVSVQNSVSDLTTTTWNYSSGFSGVTSNSQVWFLQGYKDNYYQVVFGNGRIGASLVPGNIITVEYRETSGEGGNGITNFSPMSNTGLVGVTVNISTPANTVTAGGSERETNDSIKFSAPRYYQTQGKAIVAADYKVLVEDNFPQFKSVAAYGGEDAIPEKQYGVVLISGKLAGLDFIPFNLADEVINFLQPIMSLGLSAKIIQPDIYNINLGCNVSYNPLQTSSSPQELISEIVNAILEYDADNLEEFGASFWETPLSNNIAAVDRSIISMQLTTSLTKNYVPAVGVSTGYSFSYQNPLYYPFTSSTAYPASFDPAFSSSVFSYTSNTQALIQDDGLGKLNIVSASNTEIILTPSVGSINYESGQVSIVPFIIQSMPASSNLLSFTAKLASTDILAGSGQILSILPQNVSVSVTPYVSS